jgi:hypothetical protein
MLATLLDPMIVFSFDRFGYWLHNASFRPAMWTTNITDKRSRRLEPAGSTQNASWPPRA